MPRLGKLDFDDQILDALKEGTLVVFAGAGVSMGPPSNLVGFWTLAARIAAGTTLAPAEPLDRFLGAVEHQGVNIHTRAVDVLTVPGSEPSALHLDLVRLFGAVDRIKIVTTNFDLHFEAASREVFGAVPETYRAPALPRGDDFAGIIHVHGALPHARSLILTDGDFGRAYLTEGWARRFLVSVFSSHTVLFVGYSHDDVVMNYLARALPVSAHKRFALTETRDHWNLRGIQPIVFAKPNGNGDYQELNDGVAKLAERGARGTLGWQARMAELVGRAPPVDPELVGEIEQALRDVPTCRFFTRGARDVAWLAWLDGRNHLQALFEPAPLGDRDLLLAIWLAENFAITHPDACFDLLATHGLLISPDMWAAIGRELGVAKTKPIDAPVLQRWITVMLASAPAHPDRHVLMWLAERADELGLPTSALDLFVLMCRSRFELKRGFAWRDTEDEEERARLEAEIALASDHWPLNAVWERRIRPHLDALAPTLLTVLTSHLEAMHAQLASWSKASSTWDSVSYRRAAIEPHPQDRHPRAIDVLIDAARDAMESLAERFPLQFDAWVERLVTSPRPLLRRIAVHAVATHPGRSAVLRLAWALERVGIRSRMEHHEIHRLAALNYAGADGDSRQAWVDAIFAETFEATDSATAEDRADRFRFDWLSWLLAAKPDCAIAEAALAPIRDAHARWIVTDHPDLTHWSGTGWVGTESPWSADQLLARPVLEQLDALTSFQGTGFMGPTRDGLLSEVRDATKQNASWGFDLLAELHARGQWGSDLWPAVLRGLLDATLSAEQWRRILDLVAQAELQVEHARDVADALHSLVKGGGKPFAAELIDEANAIALRLWAALDPAEGDDFDDDWLTRAINRPAGVLVEYWLEALSLALQDTDGAGRTLPVYYRERFTTALEDASLNGGYARAILAGQVAYLFRLDEAWTRERILPLFQSPDRRIFAQAWHGFLVGGRLYPELVDAMLPAFLAALGRAEADLPDRLDRLIEYVAALCVFHLPNPQAEVLPTFFQHATEADRASFASHVESMLRQLEPDATQTLWAGWLAQYWRERLLGVYAPLRQAETRQMLEWLVCLGTDFPAAVALATQMQLPPVEHSGLLFDLREGDLAEGFPEATAQLLIYLAPSVPVYQSADLVHVAQRLRALPDALGRQLREALARAGAQEDAG